MFMAGRAWRMFVRLFVFAVLAASAREAAGWNQDLIDAANAVAGGTASAQQQALVRANNGEIGNMAIKGVVPKNTFDSVQKDYSTWMDGHAKPAASAAGVDLTLQPPTKAPSPGTDTDYLTSATKPQQIQNVQDNLNNSINKDMVNSGRPDLQRQNWTGHSDVDIMADPKNTTPKDMQTIAGQNNGAYSDPLAAQHEMDLRAATPPGQKPPVLPVENSSAYVQQQQNMVDQKAAANQNNINDAVSARAAGADANSGAVNNPEARAQISQANEGKAINRIDDTTVRLANDYGVPAPARIAPDANGVRPDTIASQGAVRSPDNVINSATVDALHDHLTQQATLDHVDTLGRVAGANPSLTADTQAGAAKALQNLSPNAQGQAIDNLRAANGDAYAQGVAQQMRQNATPAPEGGATGGKLSPEFQSTVGVINEGVGAAAVAGQLGGAGIKVAGDALDKNRELTAGDAGHALLDGTGVSGAYDSGKKHAEAELANIKPGEDSASARAAAAGRALYGVADDTAKSTINNPVNDAIKQEEDAAKREGRDPNYLNSTVNGATTVAGNLTGINAVAGAAADASTFEARAALAAQRGAMGQFVDQNASQLDKKIGSLQQDISNLSEHGDVNDPAVIAKINSDISALNDANKKMHNLDDMAHRQIGDSDPDKVKNLDALVASRNSPDQFQDYANQTIKERGGSQTVGTSKNDGDLKNSEASGGNQTDDGKNPADPLLNGLGPKSGDLSDEDVAKILAALLADKDAANQTRNANMTAQNTRDGGGSAIGGQGAAPPADDPSSLDNAIKGGIQSGASAAQTAGLLNGTHNSHNPNDPNSKDPNKPPDQPQSPAVASNDNPANPAPTDPPPEQFQPASGNDTPPHVNNQPLVDPPPAQPAPGYTAPGYPPGHYPGDADGCK